MLAVLDDVRQLNIEGVFTRFILAMFVGGVIGIERGKKGRAAGFRTYMLVCVGAALTMMLGQYQYNMANGAWSAFLEGIDKEPIDVARYSAQVVNGIGFLGAGTIIFTGSKEVKGLTTAAGLWASACMGLAVGAGFYEGIFFCLVFMFISIRYFTAIEARVREKSRNLNIYVTFDSLKNLGEILACLKSEDVRIYSVDVDTESGKNELTANAVFYLRLPQQLTHEKLMTSLFELNSIRSAREL